MGCNQFLPSAGRSMKVLASSFLWLVVIQSAISSRSVQAAGIITVYWGQGDSSEGTLASACNSGHYKIIQVGFLSVFGNNQTPQLNLAGHCDPSSNGCQGLTSDINTCHNKGVKILLSIGGGAGSYKLISTQDAKNVAAYLWNGYLGGKSSSVTRPLGSAVLDGIDFDIEQGSDSYYATLATQLKNYASSSGTKVYLSAAPQCPYPDAYDGPGSGTMLQTGLFDYVYIQFYNNYCEYSGGFSQMTSVWNEWSSGISSVSTATKIFLGLPASSAAAGSGYTSSSVVVNTILPKFKKSSNYGGVMLYDVAADKTTGFSSAIASAV